MRRAVDDVLIDSNLRLKFSFLPTTRGECAVNCTRHLALPATADRNVSLAEAKGGQDGNDIIPFFAKISSQNRRSVPPLMNVVILADELREIAECHKADLLGTRLRIQLFDFAPAGFFELHGRIVDLAAIYFFELLGDIGPRPEAERHAVAGAEAGDCGERVIAHALGVDQGF